LRAHAYGVAKQAAVASGADTLLAYSEGKAAVVRELLEAAIAADE
jgi:hypothetical protein